MCTKERVKIFFSSREFCLTRAAANFREGKRGYFMPAVHLRSSTQIRLSFVHQCIDMHQRKMNALHSPLHNLYNVKCDPYTTGLLRCQTHTWTAIFARFNLRNATTAAVWIYAHAIPDSRQLFTSHSNNILVHASCVLDRGMLLWV